MLALGAPVILSTDLNFCLTKGEENLLATFTGGGQSFFHIAS